MEELKGKIFKNIHQIGIVTKNARETIRRYFENYGIGPWNLWEFGPEMVENMQVRGKRADYRMIVATCKKMNIDFEIIEPLDNKSIYYSFLNMYGEGIQHINYDTFDYDQALDVLKNRGVTVSQFGNLEGKHKYIYFDTERDTGHIIEISGNLPGFKRRDPEEIYPSKEIEIKDNNPVFKKVSQIGIVVLDLIRTVQNLNDKYTIGPWKFYRFNPTEVEDMRFMGKKVSYCYKMAVCNLEGVELALVQPEDSSSIFSTFIKKFGQGPCFVSFEVDNLCNALELVNNKGMNVTQSGIWYGRRFSFINSEADLKFSSYIYEYNKGFEKPNPYRIYPN